MEAAKEDVKSAESSPDVKADIKGVPWENRAKEFERKHAESQSEVAELRQRLAALETRTAPEPDPEEVASVNQKKLQELVKDPDAYVERRIREREFQREIPAAADWLRSQPGFSKEDEPRISQIIQEHDLRQESPMLRARAAYKILQGEKLEREFVDKTRSAKVEGSMLEGPGRSTPKKDGPTRVELLAQLKDADRAGDQLKIAMLLGQLKRTPKG